MNQHDERRRMTMCIGKHKHATFEDAQRQAQSGKRNAAPGTKRKKLTAYKCLFCDWFHIGNSNK